MKRSELFTVVVVALLIFLSVLLYVVVTAGNSAATDRWSISTANQASYESYLNLHNICFDDNGTVYLADGKYLFAIGRDGGLKWKLALPPIGNVRDTNSSLAMVSIASQDGCLYAYLKESPWGQNGASGELIAVSPEGRLLWNKQYDQSSYETVVASGGTIYLVRSTQTPFIYNLTAYNPDGTTRWVKPSLFMEPVFDDIGNVYLIEGNRIPIYSDNLQAYDTEGTLLWNESLSSQGIHSPLYLTMRNGSLYITSNYGIASLYPDGTVGWVKTSRAWLAYSLTFDRSDNLYLGYSGGVDIISPEGADLKHIAWDRNPLITDGIVYNQVQQEQDQNRSLEDLPEIKLTALGLLDEKELWSYTFKPGPIRTFTIEPGNFNGTLRDFYAVESCNRDNLTELYEWEGIEPGTLVIRGGSGLDVYPASDRVYVSYWGNNYEYPAIYGKARCAYSGGLYAFDRDGKLLWEKPLDSYVNNLVEQNGTIYYSTGDGKFSATSFGFTAGLVAATAYLFLRFLLVGAVSRARSRLEKNENRTGISKFIADNPGATLSDISRGLALNVGTVRYHLLILTINHRIKADKGDARYARYFSNGRHYSAEEKLVISIMKRGQIERLLKTMIETPGLPNTTISKELGLPESAISRYLRELAIQGVVVKRRADGGKLTYVVDEKYLQIIANNRRD